ncbi:peptidoglycan endopeptidase [Bosea caraganae]|uniref:Peptidoglycan endopeptidase n=1 Tax=Bosea caraganae TaxID=2763117 RepID=A0A370LA81_9HYPH|nr:NlpC/P60 family protein [Bosea caraganae]RDJ26892.1 peptidoglycan endopeptidase [Bosea caraganae]RDJ30779.1 peptidoglycan endopeptidase [Bosea caraganae]
MNSILDRRLTPARPDLAARHLAGQVEARAFADSVMLRVVAPIAPLRREPRPDAPLDTEALAGEVVAIYEQYEGWAWGQLGSDGYVGYLPDDALRSDAPEPTHRVSALLSHVYPGPSIKLPPLALLPLGATVAVSGESGDFLVLADGGYLWRGHLQPPGAVESDFVAVAERFEHLPYLWGGKTAQGLDCSGLTQVSLAAAGIAAPRDTDMQEQALGTALAFDDSLSGLKRGDIVFWKGHVGLMTDAETLLHATAYTMNVYREPLRTARDRISKNSFGAITSIRRLG